MVLTFVLFMGWQIGNFEKINCVIFNTIQGVFALSSYLDGLQPVFIYRQSPLFLVSRSKKEMLYCISTTNLGGGSPLCS